jgi:hypothetical protein
MTSFRTLAKVLTCLGGLEKEAAIAASAQLYVMDRTIYNNERTCSDSGDDDVQHKVTSHGDFIEMPAEGDSSTISANGSSGVTDASSAVTDVSTIPDVSTSTSAATDSNFAPETKPDVTTEGIITPFEVLPTETNADMPAIEDASSETDEDIDSNSGISCDECGKSITNWKEDSAYLCLYCTDIDICGTCFETRRQRERGELPAAWRTQCPKSHKHIKAPIEGWGGVKDGVITIGSEKIVFKEWLKDLKDVKWPNAWKAFWAKEMLD